MFKKLLLLTSFVLVLSLALQSLANAQNQIPNWEFDEPLNVGTSGHWWLWQSENAALTVVQGAGLSGNNALKVDTSPGSLDPMQVISSYLKLEQDVTYVISFMAKADTERTVSVKLQGRTDNDWQVYWAQGGLQLTTEPQTFTFEYTHTGSTVGGTGNFNADIDWYFTLSGTDVAAYFDRVWLGQENPPSPDKAHKPKPSDGAIHEDTWANLSWDPGISAATHDVYFGDNFDDVNNGAESTFQGNQAAEFYVVGFPGFAFPDGLIPGTTYYWRIDEINENDPNSPWRGDVWSFTIPPKTAYAPDPADAAEQVDLDVTLRWTGGFGSKLHTVYFGDNFDDVNGAAGGLPQGTTTYNPGPLKMAQTYYWRVDEFDIIETHKGHVWSFTTQGAVGNPNPANGAVDVKQTQIITFSPSIYAASHELYFGTDKDAVKNAGTSSPEYKGTRDLGAESYDPGKLELGVTYYWRVDEVNNVNPDSPWPGILWSFTTAEFLVVDDFEDYDSGDNQIWYIWKDGLGYAAHSNEPAYPGNGTGSAVGDESTASFAEETIVHGGNQSMPFWYDNSILMYSEVEKTLTYPRDWTEGGVVVLSIWFRGNSDNAAEAMYVALDGSAVVTHDNPNAAQIDEWTEWPIDLQAFADLGVNLANVNTIAIGFGDKKNPVAGGSGMMYFDDIRLYPPAPEPTP